MLSESVSESESAGTAAANAVPCASVWLLLSFLYGIAAARLLAEVSGVTVACDLPVNSISLRGYLSRTSYQCVIIGAASP